jgi:hypothetical protein
MNDGQPGDGQAYATGNLEAPGGYEPEPEYGYEEPEELYEDEHGNLYYPDELEDRLGALEAAEGYPRRAEAYEGMEEVDLRGAEVNSEQWNSQVEAIERAHPALLHDQTARDFLDFALEEALDVTNGDEELADELAHNPDFLSRLADANAGALEQAVPLEHRIDQYQAEKARRREILG